MLYKALGKIQFGLIATLLFQPLVLAEHGVILQYHHVALDTPASTTISPSDFRKHMDYLRDNGFSVLPLNQLVEDLKRQMPIPDKSVAITFDDGYLSIYTEAYPLLQQYGFPFTVFISTQPIDDEQHNFMNWSQIKDMSDNGVIIANHMVDHPYMLTRLGAEDDQAWIERLRRELVFAEKRIEFNTGQHHRYLAYPYGEFDPEIKRMLSEEGYVGFAQNSGAVGYYSDFLALPRFPLASIYADLETARIKFDSLAFHISSQLPLSPLTSERRPGATLKFEPGQYSLDQIGCYANSQPISLNWLDKANGLVELVPDQDFNGRRWRYVCTAPLQGSGRFFWHSIQWINTD